MKRAIGSLVAVAVFLAMAGISYGQGGTTSTLAGVVVDGSGALIPGADVTARHNATGVTVSAVTNSEGAFSFPALNIGRYTVTVSLQGFKTAVINNVVLTSGAGANVRTTLEVGALEETVTVSSQSEIVQTQNSTISTTINTTQITKLPLTSRSAMDFVPFMPGVATTNGNRQSIINGLPRGTINITLDGVNIQDNTLRSTDGFFAIVAPRLDAIEEVTVQTASQGADAGGQGAVQVKFVTRAGTNNYTGSGYYYYRTDDLNANTWFNNRNGNPKPALLNKQGGGRIGGPIMRNKAFFFVNWEETRTPSGTSRQRFLLSTPAQQGIYTYTSGGVTRSIDLLALAAANGQTSTLDPTIRQVLADIRSSTGVAGGVNSVDANIDRLTFNNDVESTNHLPTLRGDVNLTDKHRASVAWNYQKPYTFPDTLNNRDPSFPGFPVAGGQESKRIAFSTWFRSNLRSNLVNEGRYGYSGAPVYFNPQFDPSLWSDSPASMNGVNLTFPSVGSTLQSPGSNPTPSSRNATADLIEDTVTWLKGKHSLTTGFSWTQYTLWANNQTLLPTATFGVGPADPALAMFNGTNLPNASSAQLTAAQNLYALLTGRINQVTSDARIDEQTGQYTYLGLGVQRARMRETDVFIQDQWRIKSNVTINAGVRYGLQFPFSPLNSNYSWASMTEVCGVSGVGSDGTCNLFQPGIRAPKTTLPQFTEGTPGYNTDTNNIAPSIGVVWTPQTRHGWLGTLMGPPDQFVIRGGYARNYSRPGLTDFSTPFNNNTGLVLSLTQVPTTSMLLRDGSITQPPFNPTPAYPLTPSLTSSVNGFAPNIQVPSADSFTVGIQRALSRNMSMEIRYVGTRGHDAWVVQNYNEFNIIENGFLNEFRQAQANLKANIAAGQPATFAYTGASGTVPLPIFLAYFNGVNSSQAGDPSKYTGANWISNTNQAFLAEKNPNPQAFACLTVSGCSATTRQNGFIGNATFRANAAAAGLPANFFIANPDTLAGANITNSIGSTRYNALQTELRRRFSNGLQFQANYVYGKQYSSNFGRLNDPQLTLRKDQVSLRQTSDPGDITHTFKMNVVYDLPFGEGHRFGSGNGVVSRLTGGWQVGVASIIRSGQLVDLGNLRLVGMTAHDVEKMFKLRFDDAGRHVYLLPQDVIDNTIAAFNTSPTSPTGYAGAPPTGRYFAPANGPDCIEVDAAARYGDCAGRSLVVTGPTFQQTDLRFTKRTAIAGRTNFEFGVNVLNVFNNPNFLPVGHVTTATSINGGAGSGTANTGTNVLSNYELTALAGTNTSRLIELVFRVNW
jgi:hypothetical protein